MKGRVALVTGANKGIGLEIVRKLHKSEANMTVLLGARNEELGQKAVESFNDSHVLFIKLDLNSHDTITRAAHHVKVTSWFSRDRKLKTSRRIMGDLIFS
eukprot:TRINITY_DN2291_c0_g1_i1.p1 TRINITY_DN2291_c0_g1~~TRINITY_DN2291_c0_g1_i1.p1  ORF type:complete len:100 (-),score=18.04 TRINITY_DN2291_c0_g1_i1:872-1171(-)